MFLRYANERRGYVFACRGVDGDHPHIWPGKYSESKVTGRKDRFYAIAVDMAKREIYGRLAYEAPEPGVAKAGYIHFPIAPEIGAEYFAQLNAERPVRHKRLGGYKVIWTKIRPTQRGSGYAGFKSGHPAGDPAAHQACTDVQT